MHRTTPLLIGCFALVAGAAYGQNGDEVVQLSPFEVHEAAGSTTYHATESVSASEVAIPIRELPVQLDVITQSMIADSGALDIAQLMVNVMPGVTSGEELTGQEAIFIHGYAAPVLRDGFRLDNDTTDLAEIDRVEIAHGPSAVLYGSGATGGAVNRVTKVAQFKPYASVQAGFGNYGYEEGMVDVTGPLNLPALMRDGQSTLAYRVILSHESNTSDIDFYRMTHNLMNGSLRWAPTENLMFTFEASSVQRHGKFAVEVPEDNNAQGILMYNKNPTGLGYGRSIMGPGTFSHMRGDNYTLTGNWKIVSGLTLNLAYNAHRSDDRYVFARNIDNYAAGKPAEVDYQAESVSQRQGRAQLLWDFDSHGVRNKMIVGWERGVDTDPNLTIRYTSWVVPPDFAVTQAVLNTLFARNPNTNRYTHIYSEAYRANDFMTLWHDRLHLMGAVRKDEPTKTRDTVANTYTQVRGATTHEEGVVFDITKGIGIFANDSTSFLPNSQVDPLGNQLAPQSSKGQTAGLKYFLWDGKVTGTTSWFWETTDNIPQRIGQTNTFNLLGETKSNGIDINVVWDILPNWTFEAGGSFFSAITAANPQDPTQVGLPPRNVITNSANFETRYDLGNGFTVGFSGYYHAPYPNESGATQRGVVSDEQTIINGLLRYSWRMYSHRASVTLNVLNLANRTGYIIYQQQFGPPRQIRCTFKYEL